MKKVFPLVLLAAATLTVAHLAYAGWAAEQPYFEGGVKDFGDKFGHLPKAVILQTDLDGKPVDPDEVAQRPGSYMVGVTCMRFVTYLAKMSGNPIVRAGLKNVDTITCQYAHYNKADPSKETDADGAVLFTPAKGGTVSSIKILMNQGLGAGGHWEAVVDKAVAARFPGAR